MYVLNPIRRADHIHIVSSQLFQCKLPNSRHVAFLPTKKTVLWLTLLKIVLNRSICYCLHFTFDLYRFLAHSRFPNRFTFFIHCFAKKNLSKNSINLFYVLLCYCCCFLIDWLGIQWKTRLLLQTVHHWMMPSSKSISLRHAVEQIRSFSLNSTQSFLSYRPQTWNNCS